jgi:hypothetical protein
VIPDDFFHPSEATERNHPTPMARENCAWLSIVFVCFAVYARFLVNETLPVNANISLFQCAQSKSCDISSLINLREASFLYILVAAFEPIFNIFCAWSLSRPVVVGTVFRGHPSLVCLIFSFELLH